MTTFNPILDRIIIKEKTIAVDYGPLIVPDFGKERVLLGEVIATGPGLISPFTGERTIPQCKVGDLVLFPINNGIKFVQEMEEYFIIKETEILTILTINE